ncbi:MAG: tRNA-dihydrouridine synthase family protein [Lachnospiraceae bacterium]|nr:tRNA-dihydrouridine synthase family protein [Lachnospiraceae bacterium]
MITIAMAPMEGITTAIYRRIYKRYFEGVDVFYTPFLSLNQTHKFKTREKKEFLPFQDDLIPQVLTNSAADYIWAAGVLQEAGYDEININMGCPSKTVVTKHKGSGMLSDIERLKRFYDEIYEATEKNGLPAISVKTRIGMEDLSEADEVADILASYPFSKVIIHPRLQNEFYGGSPHMEVFEDICGKMRDSGSVAGIIYNGDLNTTGDVEAFYENHDESMGIMLGRGLLKDPLLPSKIKGLTPPSGRVINSFIRDLYDAYETELSGQRDVLFKMKDVLMYMLMDQPPESKTVKRIKKAKTKSEMLEAVMQM